MPLDSAARKTVVIVGQGYVGLPISMRAVEAGFSVVGIDSSTDKVASLKAGVSFVEDISNEELGKALESGLYLPTTDYSDGDGFDVAIVAVPTPLKESLPDLSYIEDAARCLAPLIKPGATVVLESTTHPGTTEELFIPLLEEGSSLKAGADFFVGFSPERIDPGNKVYNFRTTAKIVSGIDEASLNAVNDFYSRVVDTTVPVSGTREAELAKLLENTFRHINIALVNEMAIYARKLGVDIWEAIDAAATKPFGFMKFTPGPGVGGHCLPVDPSYLSWQIKRTLGHRFQFVELANDINDHMPDYVVQRAIEVLNEQKKSLNGSTVVVLGLAYKKNSGDMRESPAHKVIEILGSYGAEVVVVDGYVSDSMWPKRLTRCSGSSAELAAADLLVLITDHDDFDYDQLYSIGTPILDTRHRLDASQNNIFGL